MAEGEAPRERARREISAGGVVFRRTGAGHHFLLIRDPYARWGLPKGHVERGESDEEAARREVAEETGLADVRVHGRLSTIDWYFRHNGRVIHKVCHFFLVEAPTGEPRPLEKEHISACSWLPYAAAVRAIDYENARHVLREAGRALGEDVDLSAPGRDAAR